MKALRAAWVWCLSAALCPGLPAQGYRVRIETQAQAVTVRGIAADSILATETVTGANGGRETPDGFAVRCVGADPYCTYFRPGPERRGGPFTTLIAGSLWGIGMRGVSFHGTARLGVELGDADVWPGSSPAVQLLEGYAQYAAPRVSARLGRLAVGSRLGTTAFDGVRLGLRDATLGVEVSGFAGLGLARGTAVPVTSPALNPLDDFQPQRRQIVAGVGAGVSVPQLDFHVDYLREVDRRSDYFVSERIAVVGVVRPVSGATLTGGADYDLAAGWWGSAEVTLNYANPIGSGALGLRRYRPHFDLWTIWGAFSPVPYRAAFGRISVHPRRWLWLRGQGERYRFDDAAAETPLVNSERDGWRWEVGATIQPIPQWSLDAGYHVEFGPGAASAGVGGSVAFAPSPGLQVALQATQLDRALEFRFADAGLWVFGVDARATIGSRLRAFVGASRYAEDRDRPDAGALSWNQVRFAAGVVLELGGAMEGGAMSVIRRLPGGRSER